MSFLDTALQKKVIAALQGDIPLEKEPFKKIAGKLGLSQEELIKCLEQMKSEGTLRRVGAVLYHRRAGFAANAMVAWRVPEGKVDSAGYTLASFPEASHVYRRPCYPEWPYNIYTMIHGTSREDCEKTIERMARESEIDEFIVLYSTREFKKISMNFYPENQATGTGTKGGT